MARHRKNWKLWKDTTFIIGLCIATIVVVAFIVLYLEKG